MDWLSKNLLPKLIVNLIKFHVAYFMFGSLAMIIIFASADTLYFVQNGSLLFIDVIKNGAADSEAVAWELLKHYFNTALNAVPFDRFFDEVFGLSIDGGNGNIITFTFSVFNGLRQPGGLEAIGESFIAYLPNVFSDIAVSTLAAFVIFAVIEIKGKLFGKYSNSASIGLALASVFWIFAGYTFGDCVVRAFATFIPSVKMNVICIILILLAVGLEVVMHARFGAGSILRLLAVSGLKIVFGLIKAYLAWYLCKCIIAAVESGVGNELAYVYTAASLTFSLIILCALFLMLSYSEQKASNWAEGKHS